MNKFFKIICVTVSFFLSSQAFAQNPKKIVELAQETVKLKGAEAISTMEIFDSKGRRRVRKLAQITRLFNNGKTEKKLIRFLSPADIKGTGFLTFDYETKDDDMWLYMPALRKTRRIVSSEKSKNFMGSEFSYSDMSFPNLDEFKYKLIKEEQAEGVACFVIDIVPLDEDIADEYGFSRKTVWISKKIHVIRKALYYDLDGTLEKEFNVKSVKLIDKKGKKYRPMHLVMRNVQNKRHSVLKINKIKFSPGVKVSYFSPRYLER